MESRLAEVVDKIVIVEVDTELSLCSCENDVVDETCSLGGNDTCGVRSIAVKSTELNIEKGLKIKDFRELGMRLSSALSDNN